ncbi:hypothetical protein [Pseudooceanicola spongiae]|uniref:Uncharacterized protein n=1 Tax=Pseudooceanicola spongiae TaxID=2613965 RepID=A0A7L9WKX2_9RHOB|nr:hypothetical protein [Pseudooceanicola spongiae]QOL80553.1 hypothetical protein F3W81_06845 [Pseudooceanicola spongiae]
MSIQMPIRSNSRSRPVQAVSILQLVEWAFQREFAQIDLDRVDDPYGAMFDTAPSFGMEYLMIERARLGCKVDGGGRSEPHPDADAVASALAVLPEGHGGRRMALRIAELARAGEVPNWRMSETPRVVPVEWRSTKHGEFARTESGGMLSYISRGKLREVETRYCPIRVINPPRDASRLRRDYLGWWGALREVRDSFRIYGGLTSFVVTEAMPPRTPWNISS